MNKLLIAIITSLFVFLVLFLSVQLDLITLSDPISSSEFALTPEQIASTGSTDGLIILATLAFVIILIPIIHHFRLTKKNGNNKKLA